MNKAQFAFDSFYLEFIPELICEYISVGSPCAWEGDMTTAVGPGVPRHSILDTERPQMPWYRITELWALGAISLLFTPPSLLTD